MKILVLTKRQYRARDLLDDRFGRFRELPLELARLGHEVRGVALSYRPRTAGWSSDSAPEGKAAVSWLSVNLGGAARYWIQIKKLLEEFRPDVVWACSDAFHVVFGVWIARRYGVPCVADLYDNFAAFPATRFSGALPLFERALRRAAGVTCFSRLMAERVEQKYRPAGAVEVIESGVRTDLFFPRDKSSCRKTLGLPEDARIVGTAGALYKNRGIDALLRGFEILAAEDGRIHLALAGAREAGVRIPRGGNVHDFGMLAPDRVPLLIGALDVAVSCYRDSAQGRYSFPQKAYEILACGTPIAAAAVGSMNELLAAHPECLFEPENPESLARAVRGQLDHPAAIACTVPSWADSAAKLEKFLLRIGQTARPVSAANSRS